jgi:hypothetical protein
MMFALSLITEVDGLYTSLVGWIVIAICLSVIGTLQLAGSFLIVNRALRSTIDPGLQTNGRLLDASSALEPIGAEKTRRTIAKACYTHRGR